MRRKHKERHPEGKVIPEQRLPIQIFGVILSMMGILGYGWMIHFHIHVAAVLVFAFMAGFGMTWVFVTNTTYLTECSPGMPASLVAIAAFFRNMGAAISSVVIDPLIKKMTFGWCFTGLALIDLASVLMVIALMVKGPQWREELEAKKKENVKLMPKQKEHPIIISAPTIAHPEAIANTTGPETKTTPKPSPKTSPKSTISEINSKTGKPVFSSETLERQLKQ